MAGKYDRFMVHVDIGTEEKLARLTDAERLCHIAGVLAIAAKAPIRGRLLVGDQEAEAREIARRASVSERVARSTVKKLVEVGVLVRDDDLDCWRVHNWENFNPEPKQDATNAERQRRYRERRNAARNAQRNGVTPVPITAPVTASNAPEVKKEVEQPPQPPTGGEPERSVGAVGEQPPPKPSGGRQRDQDAYDAAMAAWCAHHFPAADPRAVRGAIEFLCHDEDIVIASELRRRAVRHDIWAAQLGLTATERSA